RVLHLPPAPVHAWDPYGALRERQDRRRLRAPDLLEHRHAPVQARARDDRDLQLPGSLAGLHGPAHLPAERAALYPATGLTTVRVRCRRCAGLELAHGG